MPERFDRKRRSSARQPIRTMAGTLSRSLAMTDEAKLWDAVLRRDTAATGEFVYAVKTTGVYCRPTCASRRPLRKNVAFFSTTAEARAEGYRACKRCRPDDAGKSRAAAAPITAVVHELTRQIDANPEQ